MTAARNSDSAYLTRIQNQSGIVPHFARFSRRRERAGALPPSWKLRSFVRNFPSGSFPFPYLFFILPHFCPASRDSSRRSSHTLVVSASVESSSSRGDTSGVTLLGYIAFRLPCTSCDVNPFVRKPVRVAARSSSTVATYNHNDRHRRADNARARARNYVPNIKRIQDDG